MVSDLILLYNGENLFDNENYNYYTVLCREDGVAFYTPHCILSRFKLLR